MGTKLIVNEAIKASEVQLTGLNGEDLGVVPTVKALLMAKELKVDLVCTSLLSSPPPCKLMSRSGAQRQKEQEQRETRLKEAPVKVKEIRLTANIEDHDYDTKQRQAAKLLESGSSVMLVVKIQGKEGPQAKALLERLITDLTSSGKKATGIQLSGKQAAVQLLPN
ncbi:translation initiation factor IF-3 [Paenibacillus sp. GSMTC-2017]|uniref:translation initiation factor IF-3 n=1 Tax=Paenibacillus sp. GSMTC-2017 TaxID=2794350 RepID=UPI0018D97532|nr:translation initiation factor IF-3 [Paenibacillus sp. GSMTC-2017]MBH5318659.1 translation initiation factor IF-3 [Paenibacillus sp. GSMTC-2017]